MIRELLDRVVRGGRLSRDEAFAAVRAMVHGGTPDALVGALLAAMAARGETEEELLGGALALRAEALPFPSGRDVLLDTCGTGGDASGTYNISTAAALVAASAGVAVVKHGNRSFTGRSGSADVLEALGAQVDLGPEGAARLLEETGFAFLYARRFHPAMRNVADVRAALGIRTLFNWLGPLSNPARATHQLLGISDGARAGTVARVLQGLGVTRALVVHGTGGLDELALAPGNTVLEVRPGVTPSRCAVEARALGLPAAEPRELRGGDPPENARILRALFAGEPGPRRDVLVLNSAAALWIASAAPSLAEAGTMAAECLDSGATLRVLERYVALTHRVGES